MLIRKLERFLFFLAILLGVVVCFYVPPKLRSYVCPLPLQPQYRIRIENNQEYPQKNYWQANIGKDKYRAADKSDQKTNNGDWLQIVFCGELRISDLALVFFTYCLVIVGWFTLRSNQRNTEAVERAYIFPGNSPLHFRNRRINFWLAATNTGRCPGGLKEIKYAFVQRENLPRWRWQADWQWEVIPYDWITPPTVRRERLRRVQGPIGDCFFVMKIKYQDLFTRRMHHSWMCMRIRPDAGENERTTRGGGDTWNYWN
jgi:hypothetical protein